ncbi:unnamed protein product [Arabis nemorensis]|uniref:Uncharacterized protein n=1 Tax=Arabis nemorensis TaxID=586526 RepID=A0A565BAP1_9BRAS|nr:unnamed protein product [Arabis nemorensis]
MAMEDSPAKTTAEEERAEEDNPAKATDEEDVRTEKDDPNMGSSSGFSNQDPFNSLGTSRGFRHSIVLLSGKILLLQMSLVSLLINVASKKTESDTEEGEIKSDGENVPLTDIDEEKFDYASSEGYEFSDKEKEAEYKRAGKRKMTSGEGTSKERKKRRCDQNRALRRNPSSHSQMAQHYHPQPLYQNPMLGGQGSTMFPGPNYYGMQQQPSFNPTGPITCLSLPIQPLMMMHQQQQFPPGGPYGSFVFSQNFNPPTRPTQSQQGFTRGRDQDFGRGRGRDQDYGRGGH